MRETRIDAALNGTHDIGRQELRVTSLRPLILFSVSTGDNLSMCPALVEGNRRFR